MSNNEYSKYISFKNVLEELFGSKAWYDLKISNHLPTWRKYASKTLKASKISIDQSIHIFGKDWKKEVTDHIDRHIKNINDPKIAKDVDDIISLLAAAYIKLSFLQIGFMPVANERNLSKINWQLNKFRSVQYVQTQRQLSNLDNYRKYLEERKSK